MPIQMIDRAISQIGSQILGLDTHDYVQHNYGVHLYPNQIETFDAIASTTYQKILLIEARGGGKTYSVALSVHYLCSKIPKLRVTAFGPKFSQGKRILSQMSEIDNGAIDKGASSTTTLVFKNGSKVTADSANEKANIEGEHPHIIIIDERHKCSDYAISNKIIPMLGSAGGINIYIEMGVALGKGEFYKDSQDPTFKKIIRDWIHCDRLKINGSFVYNGVEYPKFASQLMPFEKKLEYFGDQIEKLGLSRRGQISLMDWITQYELTWLENIERYLSENQMRTLGSGLHKEVDAYDNSGIFVFGLDTAGGTVDPETLETDKNCLAIWALRKDEWHKVAAFKWEGNLFDTGEYKEVFQIIKRYNCVKGCADYSNVAQALVPMMQKEGINVEGVMYAMKDKESHKGLKMAMFDHFATTIDLKRAYYPQIFSKEKDEEGKVVCGETMYASYIEWTMFERRIKDGRIVELTAPAGQHDDHCLSKDTIIPLCNGQNKTIEELSKIDFEKENHYVYSIKQDELLIQQGRIKRCWKKGKQKVIKIIFDNDEYLECTADHLIMMRNGFYCQAKDLTVGDSLMPLYRKDTKGKYKGYEMIYDIGFVNEKKWKAAHKLFSFGRNKQNNLVVHHIDYNKKNNYPKNLKIMSQTEHIKIHNNDFWNSMSKEERSLRAKKGWKNLTKEQKEKRLKPSIDAMHKANLKENMTKEQLQNRSEISKRSWTNKRRRQHSRRIKEIFANMTKEERYERNKKWFLAGAHSPKRFKNLILNHKVKAIVDENKEVDVYDMEIENFHNFAIKSGVFVHNCNADVLALWAGKNVHNAYKGEGGEGWDFYGSRTSMIIR